MSKSMESAVSRRTFVKGSALAGLGAATLGSGALFGCASESQPKEGGDAGADPSGASRGKGGVDALPCELRRRLRAPVPCEG